MITKLYKNSLPLMTQIILKFSINHYAQTILKKRHTLMRLWARKKLNYSTEDPEMAVAQQTSTE